MIYYKTKNNEFYAFEDDIKQERLDSRIEKLGLTSIEEEELKVIQAQKDIDSQVVEKTELAINEKYLKDTDYISTKCYELKLDIETEYPSDFIRRKAARLRINELRVILQI
jgi:hypothetical protein